jgi:hypothetical protein
VFGPERIAKSRRRARNYFINYPRELTNVFTAAALASFDWHQTNTALAWFDSERVWIHPNAENLLEVDAEARALNVAFDSPELFPKTIAALRDEKTKLAAASLLTRYAPEGPGKSADADSWQKWWQENSPYLFYSELGGYRWYVDPLAKKRGVPAKDLHGPLRATKS